MFLHQLPDPRCENDGRGHRRHASFETGRRRSVEAHRGRRHSSKRVSWHISPISEQEVANGERTDINDELTLGKLPPISDRIKADHVLKLCQEEWQHRYVLFTADDLIIALPGSNEISDRLPLHEIRLVTKVHTKSNDILSSDSSDHAFNVHTISDGYNCGREYCFRVNDAEQFEEWTTSLIKISKHAAKRVAKRTLIESHRIRARKLTSSNTWQRVNSFLVAANLVVIIAQTQVLPIEGSGTMEIFEGLDVAFTSMFAVELVIHLFAYWFRPFIKDGWLIFDFIVVTISMLTLTFKDLPGVSILRLMRTFRVLRLFNRMRSLRTLINALAASLVPVLNAFVMVILVCIVFAIMGVELFGTDNPEYFGSFIRSYWTILFLSLVIVAVSSWAEIASQLSKNSVGENAVEPIVACFMCAFIVVVTWVLLPVVVAVLLDNFIRAVSSEKLKAIQEQEDACMAALGMSMADIRNPLDPVLENLAHFRTSDDLSRRIGTLFRVSFLKNQGGVNCSIDGVCDVQVLDIDVVGSLGFEGFQEGLKKMDNFKPRIHLSNDDYARMTKDGALCDAKGNLDPERFDTLFRQEVENYIHNRVADAYEDSTLDDSSDSAAILAALKLLLIRTASLGHICKNPKKSKTTSSSSSETVILSELKSLRTEVKASTSDLTSIRKELHQLTIRFEELLQRGACDLISSESMRKKSNHQEKRRQIPDFRATISFEKLNRQDMAKQQLSAENGSSELKIFDGRDEGDGTTIAEHCSSKSTLADSEISTRWDRRDANKCSDSNPSFDRA